MKWLTLLLLLAASSAHGEIYTWTDSRGIAHYTNSTYEIPARYRSRVKLLNLGKEQKSDPLQPSNGQPPTAKTQETVMPQRPEVPAGQTITSAPSAVIKQESPRPRSVKVRRRSAAASESDE